MMEVTQITPDATIALFTDPQENLTGLVKTQPA